MQNERSFLIKLVPYTTLVNLATLKSFKPLFKDKVPIGYYCIADDQEFRWIAENEQHRQWWVSTSRAELANWYSKQLKSLGYRTRIEARDNSLVDLWVYYGEYRIGAMSFVTDRSLLKGLDQELKDQSQALLWFSGIDPESYRKLRTSKKFWSQVIELNPNLVSYQPKLWLKV